MSNIVENKINELKVAISHELDECHKEKAYGVCSDKCKYFASKRYGVDNSKIHNYCLLLDIHSKLSKFLLHAGVKNWNAFEPKITGENDEVL